MVVDSIADLDHARLPSCRATCAKTFHDYVSSGKIPPDVTMQTITLSETAVALLRFSVKGWPMKVKQRDLMAYQELIEAGIMVPDGADFKFTEDGSAHRKELISEAEERIERERFEPPDASSLSDSAKELLRRIACGERVEVTPANRSVFRELAAARIMYLMHTFAEGDESRYRFTYWGYKQRFELAGLSRAEENPR